MDAIVKMACCQIRITFEVSHNLHVMIFYSASVRSLIVQFTTLDIMVSLLWSKTSLSQLTQRLWVAYPCSFWCTFSNRMNHATNGLTSRKRRVQRGLALAFHLEELISIESSCALEGHQRGDVKMWLLLLLLLYECVLKQSTFALWTIYWKKKHYYELTLCRLWAQWDSFLPFCYHLLSRFSYRLMLFLLRVSKFKIFFCPLRPGTSRIKTVKLDASANICC